MTDHTPLKYSFVLYDSNMEQVLTEPNMAQCNGGSMNLKSLPAGEHTIRVVTFGGSDKGHSKIWKMNSYAPDSTITLNTVENPYM